MGKQTEIPGIERKRIGALETAADEYTGVRDERMELTKRETDLKGKLLKLLHRHELPSYLLDDGRLVERVIESETVRVRKAAAPAAED